MGREFDRLSSMEARLAAMEHLLIAAGLVSAHGGTALERIEQMSNEGAVRSFESAKADIASALCALIEKGKLGQ